MSKPDVRTSQSTVSTSVPLRRLGIGGLSAIVFSMMVGSGIFNIPQNIGSEAGLASCLMAWVVTAIAMLSLLYTFRQLSTKRPELNAGIYQYALAGFGNYAGFNMAWGYWLCVCFANIAYAVMLNDSFGAFIPVLLDHGWGLAIFGSLLIWLMYFLVSNGLKTAKLLNNIMTVFKLIPIVLIIVLLFIYCSMPTLESNWPGTSAEAPFWSQVRNSMMITLWCFIGIEGAVMMSARAKRPKDVSRAGVLGFFSAWILYVGVSVLAFGILSRSGLSDLKDPSVAYLLRDVSGNWAYWFVIVSVIISVLGSWVSWSLVCAQVPMEAAQAGILPSVFKKLNRHSMPAFGLRVSSIAMNLFLFIVIMSDDVYMAALNITGMMILPCYLFSALYLFKLGLHKASGLRHTIPVALLCILSCLWMLYSSGPGLMATSIFYVAGTFYYFKCGHEKNRYLGVRLPWSQSWRHHFTIPELWVFIILCLLALASIILIATGVLTF